MWPLGPLGPWTLGANWARAPGALGPRPQVANWAWAPGESLGPGFKGPTGPGPQGNPWARARFSGTFFGQVSNRVFSEIVVILVGSGDFPYC